MARWMIPAAAALAFLGVACGAFGTHALRGILSADMLQVWQTAVQYQMVHALAMLAAGLYLEIQPNALIQRAGLLFGVGSVVFSGSLYILALTGVTWLGAVTPLGGLCFLVGWALFAFGSLKRARS